MKIRNSSVAISPIPWAVSGPENNLALGSYALATFNPHGKDLQMDQCPTRYPFQVLIILQI